ncbi:MAG: hypothetical protein HZB41_02070 [Ignavibacteriae bacterium]|nr:hypothetical protein [Ignavibacteriota bacterium]
MKFQNKKNNLISFFLVVTSLMLSIFIISCDDQDEIFVPPPTPGGCDTNNITFSGKIQEIMSSNCNCHGVSAPNFAIYDNLKKSVDNGNLLKYIQPDQHFGSVLDTCDRSQIKAWVNKGAPDN